MKHATSGCLVASAGLCRPECNRALARFLGWSHVSCVSPACGGFKGIVRQRDRPGLVNSWTGTLPPRLSGTDEEGGYDAPRDRRPVP